MNKSHIPILALLAALGAPILLGFSPIFVRYTHAEPLTIAFYRTLLSLPFLGIWSFFSREKTSSKTSFYQILLLVSAGFFFSCDLGLWNVSLLYTSVVNSTLLNNFCAFFIPIILFFLYSYRLTSVFLGSLVCAIIGTIFLSIEGFTISSESTKGDLLAILSGVSLAGYYVLVSTLRNSSSVAKLMFWSSVPCSFFLLLFALIRGENLFITDSNVWLLLFLQSIFVYVGGQGLLAYAMGHINAAFVGLTLLIVPVVAAIASWVLFGETLSVYQFIGMALVLISIAAAKRREEEEEEQVLEGA